MGEDLFAAVQGGGVLVGGLETDFYDVCWGVRRCLWRLGAQRAYRTVDLEIG